MFLAAPIRPEYSCYVTTRLRYDQTIRRLAVYPGSFDPITNGHLDIVRRALAIFDTVIVAVLVNPAKQTLFSAEERVALIEASLGNEERSRIEVRTFSGLLVDFLESVQADVLIRGLRFVSDFEYELQMALMNRSLRSGTETLFMVANPERTFVSSSLVKEVSRLGRDVARYVPPAVARALEEKRK
ncbi:MAG: pantetheine-phosphate adenylyltransferase [Candidatus Hydrogenedentota bacterium]|nr:MAG: pantetheine-phosphate adenylyltransferase [Candidatus Hydrogenedentota bacterium]